MPDTAHRDARVLVAIVHWNTPNLLEACLHALRNLPADRVAVLVIDNASTSGLPALASHAGPPLQILQLAENLGYAGAALHALHALKDGHFDALWLLNADVTVEPGTFHALEQAAAAEREAVIGCVVLEHHGQQARMPEKFLHADRRWRFGRRDRAIPSAWFDVPLRPVQAVHGAALWVPRSVIERHGLFDPGFFLYCEETDYCLRLGKLGVPIRIAGQSRVRHVDGGSSVRQPAVQQMLDYYRIRNELILWRRHAPFWLPWIVLRKLAGLMVTSVRRPTASPIRWLGLFDGLLGRSGKRFAPESVWRITSI